MRVFVLADALGGGEPSSDFARGVLHHRLGTGLWLPPLRDRRHDIPGLVEELLRDACAERQVECCGVSAEALDALEAYLWPTNIRELREVLRRALVVADDRIGLADLPRHVRVAAEECSAIDEVSRKPSGATSSRRCNGRLEPRRDGARARHRRAHAPTAVGRVWACASTSLAVTLAIRRGVWWLVG